MAHSGTTEGPYFDKQGMMGYSYNEYDGPLMCFNPAKSWLLGWYEDQTIEWNPDYGTWVGTLVGVADYGQNSQQTVVVKLVTGGSTDFYIGFNRAKGFNVGTRMAADLVTMVESGSGYSQSTYIAGLASGESYTISSFGSSGKSLTIRYVSQGSSYDEAIVAIYYDECPYPDCCVGDLCGSNQESTPFPSPSTPSPSSVSFFSPSTSSPSSATAPNSFSVRT